MGSSSSSDLKQSQQQQQQHEQFQRSKSARPVNKYLNNRVNALSSQSSSYNEDYEDGIDDDDYILAKYSNRTRKATVNDQTIARFIELQSKLETFESNGIFEDLRISEEEVEALKREKKRIDSNYRKLNEKLKQIKADYSANKGIFLHKRASKNKQMSDEQKEYLESLSALEKLSYELKLVTEQYNHSKAKLEAFKRNNQYAISLYNEQMDILHSTFEGEYGSDLEFKLENDVSKLTEQKDQLKSALIKWGYARYLLVYAFDQIRTAEQQWIDLMNLELSKTETVIYATEVKNNLMAAYQNLANARQYLKNVEMPNCSDNDLSMLQKLANDIYEYMSDDGQTYAYKLIQTMRKKCTQLNEWFEQVLKMLNPLIVEYSKVKSEFEQKSDALKRERIRLLQKKVKEKMGKNLNINVIDMVSGKESTNLSLILSPQPKLIVVNEANEDKKISEINEETPTKPIEPKMTKSLTMIRSSTLTSFQLPLPPSRNQMLDNIEDIKQQYKEQEKEWNILLNNSKKAADEKLKKFLEQHK